MRHYTKTLIFVAALSAATEAQCQASSASQAPVAGEPQPATTAASADNDASARADIVVTARRKNERLIDVPVAASVLTSADITRYSTTSLQTIASQVSQFTVNEEPVGSGANVAIRGVGSNAIADDSVEQSVAFNIDGVSSARGRVILQSLFDTANIQVLKGPQALYFGKNSPGGVVVLQSRGPTSELSGYVRAGYEFKAREFQIEGAIGGPVTDTFGLRLAGFYADMAGGYVQNLAQPVSAANNPVAFDKANGYGLPGRSYEQGPGWKKTGIRLTAAWNPTSDFSAVLKFLYSDYSDLGSSSSVVLVNCGVSPKSVTVDLGAILTTGAPAGVVDQSSQCGRVRTNSIGALNPAIAAQIPFSNGGATYYKSRDYVGSLTLNYDLGKVKLTSVSGYFQDDTRNFSNADFTNFFLVTSVENPTSISFEQELRASTAFSGPLNLTVGAFYSHDKRSQPYQSGLVRTTDPVNGGHIYSVSGRENTTASSYSFFGELNFHPVPTVEIAGGARYSHETKDGFLINDYVQPGLVSALGLALPQGVPINAHFSDDNVSPQMTVTWHPTPHTNLFLAYRTGFLSGGIANPGLIPSTATAQNVTYKSEKAHGIEGGFKFETSNRKLSGDITLYRYIYKDLQVSNFDAITTTLSTGNAGSSRIQGIELNGNYQVVEGIGLRASVGYNEATYTSFPNAACYSGQTLALGCFPSPGTKTQNLSGRTLPRAPKVSGDVGVDLSHNISSDLVVSATGDVRFSSSYNSNTDLDPAGFQNGYAVLDASLRLARQDGRWDLALIGRNLTNTYYVAISDARPLAALSPGDLFGGVGLPRTVTVQATYHF